MRKPICFAAEIRARIGGKEHEVLAAICTWMEFLYGFIVTANTKSTPVDETGAVRMQL